MKSKSNKYLVVLLIFLSLLFVAPYFGVIFYSLPRNDEFAVAAKIEEYGGYSLSSILKVVDYEYNNWEGNYSGQFFWALLNPISHNNSDFFVYFQNICGLLFFVLSWSYILFYLFGIFELDYSTHLILTSIAVILSLNCRFLRELTGWFTGYIFYTFTFMIGLLGIIVFIECIIKGRTKKRVFPMVFVCLSSVIVAGGILQVAPVICWLSFLLLLWNVYKKRKWIDSLLYFLWNCLFTMINVLAPGYKPRSAGNIGISYPRAFMYTVVCILRETKRIFTDTYVPYALIVVFILLCVKLKTTLKGIEYNPILIAFCGCICIFVSTFPVCYGYESDIISSRGYEIMDLLLVAWMVLLMASMVNYLNAITLKLEKSNLVVLGICSLLLLFTQSIDKLSIADVPSIKCWIQLENGSIKEYSDYWRGVMHYVESSAEDDVIVEVEKKYMDMESYILIDRCRFQTDPENWVNKSAAKLYGHNSVAIRVKE